MKNQKSRGPLPLPMALLINLILLFGLWHGLTFLLLGWMGEGTMGVVDSYDLRREDGRAQPNASLMISLTYHFTVDGHPYEGRATYGSDWAGPKLEEGEIRWEPIVYLPLAPWINKPSRLVDLDQIGFPGLIQSFVYLPGSLALLWLVNGPLTRGRKEKAKPPQKSLARRDEPMYCQECGRKWPEGAAFCPGCGRKKNELKQGTCPFCGEKLSIEAIYCGACGRPLMEGQSVPEGPRDHHTWVSQGFSPRYQDSEILEAARLQRKSAKGCLWFLVVLPLLGFPLAGLLIEEYPLKEGLVIGLLVALVMLVVNLVALKRSSKPVWEGVVIDRYRKEKRKHDRDTDSTTTYMEFNTVIRRDTGKKVTLCERGSDRHMYDYLTVGDRVRYHPAFGTYEKYNKTKDSYLYCNVCRMLNPIERDRCKRCDQLLFK